MMAGLGLMILIGIRCSRKGCSIQRLGYYRRKYKYELKGKSGHGTSADWAE